MFSYIVAISSMVTMALTLITITFNGSVRITAPFGEAPFEIAVLLFASGVIAFQLIKEVKSRDLDTKEQYTVAKRANISAIIFLMCGLISLLTAHSLTRYSLDTYPHCLYEKNPIMANLFAAGGYDAGLAFGVSLYSITSVIVLILMNYASIKQVYPYNMMFILMLPMVALIMFGASFFNAYSDYTKLMSVIKIC